MNFSNILNQKSVQSNIPPYFQNKESPCISYSYTRSVASKIFNYKRSLQQIDFNSLSQNPLPCTCPGSEFLYAPCCHVVTGDLSIVQNDKLRDLLRKGPKFREPVSFSWHQNFDIIMDACETYARQWAKKEDVELDTLSEWIKSIGEVVKRRIRRLKHSVNTRSESIFRDPDVVRELSRLHDNFVIVPADKASNNYTFVCKRHYVDILIEELGLHSLPGNPTYNLTDFSKEDIIKMLEFLVDNIFVVFAGKVFQQIVGIPMGTNGAPLLADIFLYSYEAEFIQSLLSAGKKRLASQFNFTYIYIDDVLSINNTDFENYLGQMYPPELEIKDTTESNASASYLDLLLSIGRDGQLRTSLYDKRDDFNFHITNFPFLSSNIPSSPAYGVFISQLIRYARACSSYECFILRAMRLSNKLLGQGYVKERLKSSLRKFYGRYGDLTKQYEVPLSRMLHDILDDEHTQ